MVIDIEELKRKKELYLRDSGAFISEWREGLEKDLGLPIGYFQQAERFISEEDQAEMIIKVLRNVLEDFITNLEKEYI